MTRTLHIDLPTPVEPELFRAALRQFASGVTIVTTRYGDYDYGATVSAFCSLSLDPPRVLVCLNKRGRCHDAIVDAGRFGVSILGAGGEELARQFASNLLDKFADVAFSYGATVVPLLNNTPVSLECELAECLDGGDHSIFIGTVVHAHLRECSGAVVYYSGAYHQIS